jgi:hypothetical protein
LSLFSNSLNETRVADSVSNFLSVLTELAKVALQLLKEEQRKRK